MKIKMMMVALVFSISSVFGAIAMGAENAPKASKSHHTKAAKKADKSQDVTYLDMSSPSKPESDMPEIVSKGKL
jgi:hypothetical protein